MKKSLNDLFDKYQSDKGNLYHAYGDFYERKFQEAGMGGLSYPPALLEIGLCGWDDDKSVTDIPSLKAWCEWFDGCGYIYGMDIKDFSRMGNFPHIKIFQGDQSSVKDLQRVIQDIPNQILDIVIDDGSHDPLHQVISLLTLWPFVTPGGLYIIEDLLFPRNAPLVKVLSTFPGEVEYFQNKHKLHCTVCIRKEVE